MLKWCGRAVPAVIYASRGTRKKYHPSDLRPNGPVRARGAPSGRQSPVTSTPDDSPRQRASRCWRDVDDRRLWGKLAAPLALAARAWRAIWRGIAADVTASTKGKAACVATSGPEETPKAGSDSEWGWGVRYRIPLAKDIRHNR